MTIHGQVADDFVQPLLYALLVNKTQKTYEKFLAILNDPLICDGKFRPQSWVVDFEVAFYQALRNVFGEDLDVIGCYFHQAKWFVSSMPPLFLKLVLKIV